MITHHVKCLCLTLLVTGCFLVTPQSSCADIVFHQGGGALQPDENIQFNEPGLITSGITVQGVTNDSGLIVNFTSDELLQTTSMGQARVEAQDGFFQTLDFSIDGMMGFHEFEFSVRMPNNTTPTPTFTLSVMDTSGVVHTSSAFQLGNGSNFFSVESINGMILKSATLMADSQILTQAAQFRVTAVPEPATAMVMLLAGGMILPRRRSI